MDNYQNYRVLGEYDYIEGDSEDMLDGIEKISEVQSGEKIG